MICIPRPLRLKSGGRSDCRKCHVFCIKILHFLLSCSISDPNDRKDFWFMGVWWGDCSAILASLFFFFLFLRMSLSLFSFFFFRKEGTE
ncbi:hypothetical protein B0H63DRAFT_470455 [Podospora didyma]|uniref:Uncharacterized protein n=1 Tax=Podospora didyma TaxID=330526 RepID=A0AAE0U1I8_9PEZI|nr:hypothetical protein B0H63DRAFT_470455 [Podospora didyma]